MLEIGRQTRPHLYDYRVRKPPPLAAREHRLEIDERVNAAGEVLKPLDARELDESCRKAQGGARAIGRRVLPARLSQSRARAARARSDRAPDARGVREHLERSPARVPRIRALVDDGAQCRGRAAHGALSRSLSRAREGARHRRRAVHDPLQRRPHVGARRARVSGAHVPVGTGGGRRRRGRSRPRRRLREPRHVRRRRHQHRRVAGLPRQAAVQLEPPGRRLSGEDADDRHPRDRRRRRQHRVDGRRRRAQGRAAKRGRRSRAPARLRERRHRAHDHRCADLPAPA